MVERDTKIKDQPQDPHQTGTRLAAAMAAHDEEANETTTHELKKAYRADLAARSGIPTQTETS